MNSSIHHLNRLLRGITRPCRSLLLLLAIGFSSVALAQEPFVVSFLLARRTPELPNGTVVTIPTMGTGYNYDVDWNNDGIYDEFGITDSVSHDFQQYTRFRIAIRGDFPRIYFNNRARSDELVSIDQWGSIKWTSMENAFAGCKNLTIAAKDAPDLSRVTCMSGMFDGAAALNQNINHWVNRDRFLFCSWDPVQSAPGKWQGDKLTFVFWCQRLQSGHTKWTLQGDRWVC